MIRPGLGFGTEWLPYIPEYPSGHCLQLARKTGLVCKVDLRCKNASLDLLLLYPEEYSPRETSMDGQYYSFPCQDCEYWRTFFAWKAKIRSIPDNKIIFLGLAWDDNAGEFERGTHQAEKKLTTGLHGGL